MSGRTTIQITRSGGDGVMKPIAEKHSERMETKHGTSFQDATKDMEDELEKRRFEWEKEVDKMQRDFFNLNAAPSIGDGGERNVPVSPKHMNLSTSRPGAEIIDINNSKTLYTERPDGKKLYRIRFDVRGFKPEEIMVRADGRKLRVSAKHEDSAGSGRKASKQFNRQMDIPDCVNPDLLQSELSADGILSVEAVVKEIPKGETVEPYHTAYTFRPSSSITESEKTMPPTATRTVSYTSSSSPDYQSNHRSSFLDDVQSVSDPAHISALLVAHNAASSPQNATERGARLSIGRYSDPLVVIVDDQRKMKLSVTVGEGYNPDEVVVSHHHGKISIKALHEQTIPWQSKRQFSREFDLPEDIEPWTLRAVLTTDGRILVGASCKQNTNHHAVLNSVLADFPAGSKECKMEH